MKLVLVKWVDSTIRIGGWHEVSKKGIRAVCHRSVGWISAKTKDSITLIPHLSEKNHPSAMFQCWGEITIPKAAIVKMKKLK